MTPQSSSPNKNSTNSTSPSTDTTPTSTPIFQNTLSPLSTNLISLNASSQIPFKLAKDGGNYGSWKSQMTNLLFGYGLLGYVDGSHSCPLTNDQEQSFWLRQDRLVLLAIQSTVHSIIGPTINTCSTSTAAWRKLETSYANRSNTRKLTLLSTLMSTKKEGKFVATYMNKIKSLVDDLGLIGHPLSDAEIMAYTLNGLIDEFKELTMAVRVRDSPISFEDLYDKLLDEEMILNHGESKDDDTQITAQLVQKQNTYKGKGNQGGPNVYNNTDHGYSTRPNSFSNHSRQQPIYRRNSPGTRFGASSQSFSPSWNTSYHQTQRGQTRIVCQLCDKPGHGARACRSRGRPSSTNSRPEAYTVDGDPTNTNKNWVLDSGATHHITSDLQNLSMHSNYVGNEDVIVGNGFEHGSILGPRPE